MIEIRHCVTGDGRDTFADWRDEVKESKAKIAIDRRVYRLELGNFGDHKPSRKGVWELRIDVGPGYRVYYCLLYTSPSPRDGATSRMPSSA